MPTAGAWEIKENTADMANLLEEESHPKVAFNAASVLGLNAIYLFFLIFLFAGVGYYMIGWPISGIHDADLWYHLNGGRFLFTHHKIPDSGFFSFIANERHWANYYWLFQAAVYSVFSFWGYHGLIIMRTALTLLLLLGIAMFFVKKEREDGAQFYFIIVISLLSMALLPRLMHAVRPHAFSYLFIVLFIGIFESRKRQLLYLLPVLSIFWANLHGVEYPVMMLICLAYLGDVFMERLKMRASFSREALLFVLLVLLTMYAVFINPFGSKLLFSPFKAAPYQHLYIAELTKPEFSAFLFYDFSTMTNLLRTLSNLLILLAFSCFFVGIKTKNIRLSQILLFAGGVYLLSQTDRFRYEFLLLSLPLVRANPPLPKKFLHKRLPAFVRFCGIVLLLLVVVWGQHKVFRPRAQYPISYANVPAGISAFLNSIEVGGKLLNYPTHGGFFQWKLGDRYKIYMDLEMMLFSDEDFLQGISAFFNRKALSHMIALHRPNFLAPPIKNTIFKKIIQDFPDYRPVFFDDTSVLYVDKQQHPEIAAQYSLDALQPSSLAGMDIAQLSNDKAAMIFKELMTLQAIYPNSMIVNRLLVQFARRQKNHGVALKHAELLIANFPERHDGFQLQGDIYFEQQKFDQALSSYKNAMERITDSGKPGLYKKISECFSKN
ncbi:tetratricopeptide repeat protein [Thermodesulfobacteriota bacterium]